MDNSAGQYKNVDEYIAMSDPSVQETLIRIRKIITQTSPKAVESISYGMPAYKLNGKPLVYFSAHPKHIGFYATPDGHEAFEPELSKYKRGKGSVQFPLDQEVPFDLIEQIVTFKTAQLS